jgi:YebC/PmpR family DNA-binding regulatory protein
MSGHSKWATTKHRKGAQDKARAKLFAKLIRQVEVAAREGGSDLNANSTLRTMFTKARDASVPLDTIKNAIKRGTGELEGVRYEAITYEGYAPSGAALIVECLTDNRNRTGAEVRTIFSRNGGSTAEPGAVAWQFERKGVLLLSKDASEDQIMAVAMDAGAEDLRAEEEGWVLTAAPSDLPQLRSALEEAKLVVEEAEVAMVPSATVTVADESEARKILRLVELLEDHDDVQAVWANFDIPQEMLEKLELA